MRFCSRRVLSFGSASLFLVAALFAYRAYAAAGTCLNCNIKSIGVTSTGYVLVGVGTGMGGACSNPAFMVFNPNSTLGKTLLSLANSAYLSGKTVDLLGTGACVSGATSGVPAEVIFTLSLH